MRQKKEEYFLIADVIGTLIFCAFILALIVECG